MIEESTTEARQGDRRRMNMRVLFWGTPVAIVLLALVALFWRHAGGM
jgi:hypothetical protein